MARKQMKLADWHNKAVELFGPDADNWRFKCPACGNAWVAGKGREYYKDRLDGKRWLQIPERR